MSMSVRDKDLQKEGKQNCSERGAKVSKMNYGKVGDWAWKEGVDKLHCAAKIN